ncbi:hypothetical protein KCP77_01365 [Salmonella enterica subsp. enterica]|nr:hypothetical protein KCP77_01365 [Salmonella enterica subsp. enterica]
MRWGFEHLCGARRRLRAECALSVHPDATSANLSNRILTAHCLKTWVLIEREVICRG